MSSPQDRPAEPPGPTLPFAIGFVPLWIVAVLMTWWVTDRQGLPPALASRGPWSGVALAAEAVRLAVFALEALVYWSAWRALGVRLRFWPLALCVLSLSMIDALAARVAELGRLHPGGWNVAARWLAGAPAPDAASGGASSVAPAVFASVGVLDVVRLAMWCDVQRRATRRPWGQVWGLTLALWSLGRLALWWSLDLMRGRSPLH